MSNLMIINIIGEARIKNFKFNYSFILFDSLTVRGDKIKYNYNPNSKR